MEHWALGAVGGPFTSLLEDVTTIVALLGGRIDRCLHPLSLALALTYLF